MENNKSHFSGFHDLMGFRVREILLVSNTYDAFVLEEDGRLSEKIFSEYLDMQLQFVPRIQRASTAEEAFSEMQTKTYDLVIVMFRIKDMDPLEFVRRIKEKYPRIYIVMLTYETISEEITARVKENGAIDKIFYWSGNNKILLAIIKYVEDLGNIESDSRQGVQAILMVEDSPVMYSHILPLIYIELMKQTSYLISQGVNSLHRLLRMRARPKILMAETYEEAVDILERYRKNLLGVISDVAYPKDGVHDQEAGLKLALKVREVYPSLPFVTYSNENGNRQKAQELGLSFLDKTSPNLNLELSRYISEYYGFGDFIFRYPDGREICRTSKVSEFEAVIRSLPEESLIFHTMGHHFSTWFYARTEVKIAEELEAIEDSGSTDADWLRMSILDRINKYFISILEGNITDFGLSKMTMENSFIKLGSGSIGGKGRGIAFFNSILHNNSSLQKFKGVRIKTPHSFVICSEVFEEFMEQNDLQEMVLKTDDVDEISRHFLAVDLPNKIKDALKTLVEEVDYPLAVRSSSILEDSHALPFAGIYSTYLLPNSHPDPAIRLEQLSDAVRLVYASVFFPPAKRYISNSDMRIEDEKMAILIQELVGQRHDDVFYPSVSGVAQSYNFYPMAYLKPEDGMAGIALGLGKAVVEGEQVYRFSPASPNRNPPYSSPSEFLKKSQNQFYALDMKNPSVRICADQSCTYRISDLERAESDGVLRYVGSTYSRENDMILDSLAIPGPRLVTFAQILKYGLFPLHEILKELFTVLKDALGSDIEIEFAVNIPEVKDKDVEFYFLQVRPMVSDREFMQVGMEGAQQEDVLCSSSHTIGNGVFSDLRDVIFVDPAAFGTMDTREIAGEIGELNRMLFEEGRRCILISIGRLGTSDPCLGIPLDWSQMSQAKVVLEVDTDKLQADPSLGSHFQHNLVSLRMGYMHIENRKTSEFINWDWLKSIPVLRDTRHVRHLRFDMPLTVKIDGRTNNGVILKPGVL